MNININSNIFKIINNLFLIKNYILNFYINISNSIFLGRKSEKFIIINSISDSSIENFSNYTLSEVKFIY